MASAPLITHHRELSTDQPHFISCPCKVSTTLLTSTPITYHFLPSKLGSSFLPQLKNSVAHMYEVLCQILGTWNKIRQSFFSPLKSLKSSRKKNAELNQNPTANCNRRGKKRSKEEKANCHYSLYEGKKLLLWSAFILCK